MDHQELLEKMRNEVHVAKAQIIDRLDGYQQRVTKLETEQGWVKRVLLFMITTAVGAISYYIKNGG